MPLTFPSPAGTMVIGIADQKKLIDYDRSDDKDETVIVINKGPAQITIARDQDDLDLWNAATFALEHRSHPCAQAMVRVIEELIRFRVNASASD